MNEEDRIGEKFCDFYLMWMINTFEMTPEDMQFEFSEKEKSDRHVICKGKKSCWKDSRFTIDSTVNKKRFCFTRTDKEDGLALSSFLAFLIEEMEKRFENLLYLETVEEKIDEKEFYEDKLVNALIGELLDREWIARHYVKKILKEKELPNLELLVQISAQKYEQRIVKTKIYFYFEEYQVCQNDIRFIQNNDIQRKDREITLNNLRTIRKIMEMSGENHGLIACKEQGTYYIEGVRREGYGDSQFCIEFNGHLKWALKQEKEILFEYHEGKVRIPVLEGSEQDNVWIKELYALGKIIPELKDDRGAVFRIQGIIEALKKQPHGTSIIFMDKKTLEIEKRRLGDHKRLYSMNPFSILEHQEEILGISSVDGAMLADASGKCHAVGAILDGKSIVKGNPGRGARYNSLVNYVNWIYEEFTKEVLEPAWCFAAIMSEDRIVNLGIPEKLRKGME